MILFSLPFQNTISTVVENSKKSAVSFFDFNGEEKITFDGEIKDFDTSNQQITDESIFDLPCFNTEDIVIKKEDYLKKIENVIHFINDNKLEKLVFSRRKLIYFDQLRISETYSSLKKTYPNALSYFFVKEEMCWMGAFSEILGKYNKNSGVFETMSVAGTLPIDKSWTKKEIDEQQTVTNYINSILKNYSQTIEKSETTDHISGNIKHLKTEFSMNINKENVEDLIKELHPTPAVCGFPKDICTEAIKNFENSDRELYAGYIKVETEEYLYYFVNLRCAKIYKNAALLFVGGGINKDSQPEKEWVETELKAEAVAKNLVISSN